MCQCHVGDGDGNGESVRFPVTDCRRGRRDGHGADEHGRKLRTRTINRQARYRYLSWPRAGLEQPVPGSKGIITLTEAPRALSRCTNVAMSRCSWLGLAAFLWSLAEGGLVDRDNDTAEQSAGHVLQDCRNPH